MYGRSDGDVVLRHFVFEPFICFYGDKKTTLTLTFEKGVEEWQTNLYLRNGGATDVEFEWHDITGVDGWQIQVSQDPLFTGESKTYYAQKCVLADGTWIH